MAVDKPTGQQTIVPRPSVVAAVAKMPRLRPEQKARLRRILPDWPEVIEATVRARHPELADAQPADPAA